jgi:elongator complex protein 5
MSYLPTILSNASRGHHPLLLLQSSVAQPGISILRRIVADTKSRTLFCCVLHPPSTFFDDSESENAHQFEVFDCAGNVPGYEDVPSDIRELLMAAVRSGTRRATNLKLFLHLIARQLHQSL